MNKLAVLLVLCSLAYATDKKHHDPPKPPATKTVHVTTEVKNTNTNSAKASADASASSKSSATATGGTAVAVGGSADAAVNNSGNSSQSQSTNSEASNNTNGNNSNNTTFKQVRQTPMAYAPDAFPTAPCVKGLSGGLSTGVFGAAFGGNKTDENCEALETARFFALNGSRLAACKIAITTKSAKKAGVTLADCMIEPPAPTPVVAVVPAPTPTPVVVPVAVIDPPVVITPSLLAECSLVGNRVTNECKARLDSAVIFYRNAGEGHLVIEVDAINGKHRAENIEDYFVVSGINRSAIRTQLSPGSNKGARVMFVSN